MDQIADVDSSTWPAARAVRKPTRNGQVSFAGAVYNIGRTWAGRRVEVFTINRIVHFACDGALIRTLPAKKARTKERTALVDPRGGRTAVAP